MGEEAGNSWVGMVHVGRFEENLRQSLDEGNYVPLAESDIGKDLHPGIIEKIGARSAEEAYVLNLKTPDPDIVDENLQSIMDHYAVGKYMPYIQRNYEGKEPLLAIVFPNEEALHSLIDKLFPEAGYERK